MRNDEPSNSELQRVILDIKQSDKEYRMSEHETLKNIEEEVVEIRIQTTKTNGRVDRLEADELDQKRLNESLVNSVESFKGDRKWLFGAFAMLIILQGALLLLLNLYIKNVVQTSVKEALSAYNIEVGN